jgi:hypothetical protein
VTVVRFVRCEMLLRAGYMTSVHRGDDSSRRIPHVVVRLAGDSASGDSPPSHFRVQKDA